MELFHWIFFVRIVILNDLCNICIDCYFFYEIGCYYNCNGLNNDAKDEYFGKNEMNCKIMIN